MGYTVFCLTDEEGHQGSGMTLAEALAKMMALAHCDYAFGRSDGVMKLHITHLDDMPEEYLADPQLSDHFRPEYRSKMQHDDDVRIELMRKFLWRGTKGYGHMSGNTDARAAQIMDAAFALQLGK